MQPLCFGRDQTIESVQVLFPKWTNLDQSYRNRSSFVLSRHGSCPPLPARLPLVHRTRWAEFLSIGRLSNTPLGSRSVLFAASRSRQGVVICLGRHSHQHDTPQLPLKHTGPNLGHHPTEDRVKSCISRATKHWSYWRMPVLLLLQTNVSIFSIVHIRACITHPTPDHFG